MIELVGLNKTFKSRNGEIVALQNIDLTIEDGDVYGIIGLSGAGKSTLVRCMNLLERPTSGRVIVDGEDLTAVSQKRLSEVRRKIGMIFQNFNLLEQRTVFENVRFPLELEERANARERRRKKQIGDEKAENSRDRMAARVRELLGLVGLEDRESAYPSQLSGGQKQRVAIARALATNPKYLLCDEATSALDPNTTASILSLLREINKKLGVTVVVITHEMKVVESICTKVAVIDQSRVAEVGRVEDVFADPQSEIAKELILPDLIRSLKSGAGEAKLRLIFNGENSNEPVISALAIERGVLSNVLFADMKDIDGKLYGHLVLSVRAEEEERVIAFLKEKSVRFKKETEL